MSRKSYPKIGYEENVAPKYICVICKKHGANIRVTVQETWMRGDDEVYYIHKSCRRGKPYEDVSLLRQLGYSVRGGYDD